MFKSIAGYQRLKTVRIAGGWACPFLLLLLLSLVQTQAATNQFLNIITQSDGGVTRVFVENREPAPMSVTFELELVNMRASVPIPESMVFPPQQVTEAFRLESIQAGHPSSFQLRHWFRLGDFQAVHDDSYIYTLPYEPGRSFRVSQGHQGRFSHAGLFAIDWKMPEGTPVRAAREGVVLRSKDSSNRGGANKKYISEANSILIQHPDGTFGFYCHLLKGGNRVKVGQYVEAGQLIGLSGNTGFSSGPHLHFAVTKTISGKAGQSIPVVFKTADTAALALVEGKSYRAP